MSLLLIIIYYTKVLCLHINAFQNGLVLNNKIKNKNNNNK